MFSNPWKVIWATALMSCLITITGCDPGKPLIEAGHRQEAGGDYETALKSYESAAGQEGSAYQSQGVELAAGLRQQLDAAKEARRKADAAMEARDSVAARGLAQEAIALLPNDPGIRSWARGLERTAKQFRLGGGYRTGAGATLRWGMSKGQVTTALGTVRPVRDTPGFLSVSETGGMTLNCWFDADRLYQVRLRPNLSDDEMEQSYALRRDLARRFGPGEDVPGVGQDVGIGVMPVILTRWQDAETEIRHRVFKPSRELPGTASTTEIIYKSKRIHPAATR